MKKVFSLVIALTLITGAMAQEKRDRKSTDHKKDRIERFKDLTPEQLATLQTKRMAIKLDLSQAQQKEILKLNTELAEKRKAEFQKFKEAKDGKKEWTAEERFDFMNKKLDARLAVQQKMKNILDDNQYAIWKKSHDKPGKHFHHKRKGFRQGR
ncbi:hypothetical protein SAMN02927921_03443 [Sinomicrobium oceani]|uniref:LTXXQ motif family protein n=1 Tax=Sinomicrobium oceani TaxID=1150368 RepID=A0A1K1REP7_9FLAO|nr:DUF4890 domain-containing protein [Sinomicrobium oceani]SFW70275.1 hypothetical protein SAMN02927921_03443 [Sinomicrobium oceani]